MPRIRWSRRATIHLNEALAYIATDNPSAAKRIATRIKQLVRKLSSYPGMGRPGRIDGTRELVITETPYVVAYQVNGSTVEILAVLHGAQDWPSEF